MMLNMYKKVQKENKLYVKIMFSLISLLWLMPSVAFILSKKRILNINSDFSFFYVPVVRTITNTKIIGTCLFVGIFLLLFILYIYIVKKANILFENKKDMIRFIIIICIIFTIMLPMTSTDVYYYIGTGWAEAKYKINPYYTSVNEVLHEQQTNEKELDEMLLKTPAIWRGQTIVYGPIWTVICRILSGLSFGNEALALVIYKMFNLILHLLNCYIIYKLTNKKQFVLLYALNPFILFNGLCNVHNDILSIMLILGALYFFKKKKNIAMTVLFTALATAIKYYAILLIPFLVIFYYRKEKTLKRILYACGWAVLFIGIIVATYMIYMKDFEVLKGIMIQQNKFTNSIFLVIFANAGRQVAITTSKICMCLFILGYLIIVAKLLFTKNISFTKSIRTYNNLLIIFIFFTITAFQSWYIIWPFATIIWQKGKMINLILGISISVELAKGLYFLLSEWYIYGKYYYNIVLFLVLVSTILLNKKKFFNRFIKKKLDS